MRAIIVELSIEEDLIEALRNIRTWCKEHLCEPNSFKYHLYRDNCIVVAEFANGGNAEKFKIRFGGLESEFVNLEQKHFPETMATVCWWRLKAEEIRVEYDGFACPSARRTMDIVARCYEHMAEHLEYRLIKEASCSSPSDGFFRRATATFR
jgi:hypothetical protein